MSEQENTKAINWDMPGYGIYTFQPKTEVEKTAIELIQLRLFILDNSNQQNIDAEARQRLIDIKLNQLQVVVLDSKTATHDLPPNNGLTQFVPNEMIWADELLANLGK